MGNVPNSSTALGPQLHTYHSRKSKIYVYRTICNQNSGALSLAEDSILCFLEDKYARLHVTPSPGFSEAYVEVADQKTVYFMEELLNLTSCRDFLACQGFYYIRPSWQTCCIQRSPLIESTVGSMFHSERTGDNYPLNSADLQFPPPEQVFSRTMPRMNLISSLIKSYEL